jgi:hypothetical protein
VNITAQAIQLADNDGATVLSSKSDGGSQVRAPVVPTAIDLDKLLSDSEAFGAGELAIRSRCASRPSRLSPRKRLLVSPDPPSAGLYMECNPTFRSYKLMVAAQPIGIVSSLCPHAPPWGPFQAANAAQGGGRRLVGSPARL